MPNIVSEETKSIIAGLDNVGAKIESVITDNKATKSAIDAEIKKLGEAQLKFAQDLQHVMQEGVKSENVSTVASSVGEEFTKSDAFKNFGNTRRAHASISTKSFTGSTASNSVSRTTITSPYMVEGIVGLGQQTLQIEGLIPHVPVGSSSVEFVRESAFSNGALAVAEGAAKPESTFTFELGSTQVETVAHWTKISKQLADDSAATAAFINAKMIYGLQLKIDQQLVNGTGASGQLGGFLKTGNCTDYSASITTVASDNLIDFALKIKTQLELALYPPKYLVLNPADWTALQLLKDSQNRYLLGGPQAITNSGLWGIPVVATASMPAGKYLMADFGLGSTIYDRQAIEVAMSDSDGSNFTSNLITLRVERRLGLAIERAAAIGGGDWALPQG